MTASRAAAQRVNTILVNKLFAGQDPLCDVPCAAVADGPDIFPYRGMRIVITENRDKASRIVNGQDATVLSSRGKTLLIQFPDNQRAFIYPVTDTSMDRAMSLPFHVLLPTPEPSANLKAKI